MTLSETMTANAPKSAAAGRSKNRRLGRKTARQTKYSSVNMLM